MVSTSVVVGNDATFLAQATLRQRRFKTSAGGTADIFGKWAGLGSRDWVLFLNSGAIEATCRTEPAAYRLRAPASTHRWRWHLAVMTFNSTAGELTIDLDGGTDRVTVAVASRMGSSGLTYDCSCDNGRRQD